MAPKSDLLQGTLDLLILRTLAAGPKHGWGIAVTIQQVTEDVLQVNQGSLYPALHRLEQQGLIESEWGSSENNRQAKFYQLTRSGRKQLVEETHNWERLATAVEPGRPVVWTIDPSEAACADCEDNSLAGPIPAGESFPTGHTSAPAHPGCRCLTLPAQQ